MNDPRTLPCFHSFCKVCLERIVENTREKAKSAKIEDFNCPSCRAVFNLKPNQEVAELSCSHVVRNMLEAVKLQRQAKHANCSKCNKQEASSRCLTCELFLCDECLAEHNSIAKNWPGFRKISCSVLTIEELAKPENQSKIKGNGASYCEKHQGKKLKFYCETCKEIICRYCMDFIHTRQDHKCEPIEHVVEKRKESLMRSINAFEKKLVSGNEALLAICDVEAKFQSNAEEVKKFVNEEKESVKDMLLQCLAENARKKHDEINELYEKNQNAIVQQKNEIESFVSDLNTSYYVAKKVAKAGTAVELIESAGMAEEKLRSIERKEKTKLTKAINYGDIVMEYEKIREDDVKKLQKLLKLGNVKVISPEKQEKYRKIKAVGEPIVHRESGQAQGSWMRDPLGLLGPEKIWYMEGYEGSTVLEFENMDNFKAGWVAKTYDLPIQYGFDGTGSVVYGRYLYYNRFASETPPVQLREKMQW
ncbi:tripartite motif-containing protein 45-like isoform X2 [Dendronephthya gigantea]|uniref:tripartite motif-containing protein 45-like isoform X2 n=1 Tax=Dendronephthya gigantea TaxID=151771 RepID=UPI00106D5BF2|nr:tripartite motif-containing protein 45-like isoform X2 [Dendronephthya gigantea]